MKRILFLFLISLTFFGCKEEVITEPSTIEVKGKVEKGPFIKGSKITIQELNEQFNPTGKSFSTKITDDEGIFELGEIELNSPYIELIADGYFYNEVTGKLSSSQISLSALADLRESTSINVNLVTHITKDRVKSLIINDNFTFNKANQQAQKEFFTAFGLQKYASKNASSFSITNGTDEAAALITISSSLLYEKQEAAFTEFIAKLTNDFKNNGTFSGQDQDDIRNNSQKLAIQDITQRLIERYQSLSKNITVKDLRYFIDWNNDGIAGNEYGNMNEAPVLKFENDTLKVATQGGQYKVKINSNILYTLYYPSPNDPINTITNPNYLFTSIKCNSQVDLKTNELILNVNPATGAWMKDTTIVIHSFDRLIRDTLIVKQDGDPNKIESTIAPFINKIGTLCSTAFDYNLTAEAFYTKSYTTSDNNWFAFYQNNVSPSSSLMYNIWGSNYYSINFIKSLRNLGLPDELESSLILLRTILYYQMTVLWGNIVYIEDSDPGNLYVTQTIEKDMYTLLINDLKKIENKLADNKDFILLPYNKLIANTLIAKLLMHEQKYQDALNRLVYIINSEHFQLSNNRVNGMKSTSSEIIYLFPFLSNTNYQYKSLIEKNADGLPIITYREVILLAAECSNRLNLNAQTANYLNQIDIASGNAPRFNTANPVFMEDIQQIWQNELKGQFSYFAFLKRNNLTEKTLNISAFRNLLPIPTNEIQSNPTITQNPGY